MTDKVAPPRVISAHTRLYLRAACMTTAEKILQAFGVETKMEVRRLRRLLDAQGCHWVPSIENSDDDDYPQHGPTPRSLADPVRRPRLSGHLETLR